MKQYDDNLILGYVEGDLSPEERARFEAQLEADAALRELVADLARDRAAVRSLPREAPPSHLFDDAMQRLERTMLLGEPGQSLAAEPAEHRRFRIGRVLSYSGLAAVILISGGVLLHTLTDVDLLDETARYADVGEWVESGGERMAMGRQSAPASPEAAADVDERVDTPEPDAETDAAMLAEADGPDLPATASPDETALTDEASPDRLAAMDAPAPDGDVPRPLALRSAEAALGEAGREAPMARESALALQRNEPLAGPTAAMQPMILEDEGSAPSPAAEAPQPFSLGRPGLLDRMRADRPSVAMFDEAAAPVRLKVVARQPNAARQDVLDWALRNEAVVIPAERATAPADPAASAGEAVASTMGEKVSPAHEERLLVQVQREQVPELLAYLNRHTGQRAGLVQSAGVVRRPVEAEPRVEPESDPAHDPYGGYRRPAETPRQTFAERSPNADEPESMRFRYERTEPPRIESTEPLALRPTPLRPETMTRTLQKSPGGALPPEAPAPTESRAEDTIRHDRAAAPRHAVSEATRELGRDAPPPPPLLRRWWTPIEPLPSFEFAADDAGLLNVLPAQAAITLPIDITEAPAEASEAADEGR